MGSSDIRRSVLDAATKTQRCREVEAFGTTLWLKPLDFGEMQRAREQARIGEGALSTFDLTRYLVALLLASCVDEHGEPVFTELDYPALLHAPAQETDKLVRVVMDINGLSEAGIDAVGKDSAPIPSGAPSSPSAPATAGSPAS